MHPSQAGRSLLRSGSAAIFFFAFHTAAARAQAVPTVDLDELVAVSTAASNDSGPAGIVPSARGFNGSLGTTTQHDSSNGWSSILNPNIAYRLNRYLSINAGTPVYVFIKDYENKGTTAKPDYAYQPKRAVLGDTTLSFEGDVSFVSIDYTGTFSMGMPTGNTDYGLGAGQVTFSNNNHFERTFNWLTPQIELGYGDSSNLVDQRIRKSYVAVGPLAHFQAGASFDLPFALSFDAAAYEELPLAKDIIYSTTGSGKKKVTTSTNADPSEDNGFITSLDIPLTPHITLSGFYNRSLRDHDDVAGFSFTFLLRAAPRAISTH